MKHRTMNFLQMFQKNVSILLILMVAFVQTVLYAKTRIGVDTFNMDNSTALTNSTTVIGAFGGRIPISVGKGQYAFIAQGDRLVVLDIQAAYDNVVATLDLDFYAFRACVSADYIYISDQTTEYLTIINVSNPLSPFMVSRTFITGIENNISQLWAADGFAYLTTGQTYNTKEKIVVVDASNPFSPVTAGSLAVDLVDFFTSGNYAYILQQDESNNANNRLIVLDMSEKTNIQEISSLVVPWAAGIHGGANYAYAACTSTSHGLQVIDVSNPLAPESVGQYTAGMQGYNDVVVRNSYAYLNTSYEDLIIVDVTDASNPQYVSEYDFNSEFSIDDVTSTYVCIRSSNRFYTLDVTDPFNPFMDDPYHSPTMIKGMDIGGNRLYCTDDDDRAWIYDISYPARPEIIGDFQIPDANKVFVHDFTLYIHHSYDYINIYNVTDPTNVQLQSTYETWARVINMDFRGNYAYVLKYSKINGEDQSYLDVVNVTNPSSPYQESSFFIEGFAVDLAVPTEGNLVYVAYKRDDFTRGFQIIDVTSPSAPIVQNSINTENTPQSILLIDHTLFLGQNTTTDDDGIIDVYDISDPINPQYRQTFDPDIDSEMFDMISVDGFLLVSFVSKPDEGVTIFYYDFESEIFNTEASIPIHLPGILKAYAPSATAKITSPLQPLPSVAEFVTSGGYSPTDQSIYGKGGVIILGQPSPPPRATLVVNVAPDDAQQDGCNAAASPPGPEYIIHSTVSVEANAAIGWVFTEWSGGLSGGDNPATLKMDDDKEVTANFLPVLELSLTSPDTAFLCPPMPEDELDIAYPDLTAWGVDWDVTSITFDATGDVDKSYMEAFLEHDGTEIQGSCTTDENNKLKTITFTLDKTIKEGNTLSMVLFYKFDFGSYEGECPIEEMYTCSISINSSQVDADPIPEDTKPGRILPPPTRTLTSNAQMIGCVWNISTWPNTAYNSIQSAIDDEQTVNGNIIELCPWTYKEEVAVSKSLTIRSREGSDKTVVQNPFDIDNPLERKNIFQILADNVTIQGITFLGGLHGISNSMSIFGHSQITIGGEAANHSNRFLSNIDGINLEEAGGMKIIGNVFEGNFENGMILNDCESIEGSPIEIKGNTVKKTNEGIGISLICASNTVIRDNTIGPDNNQGIMIENCTGSNTSPIKIASNTVKDNATGINIMNSNSTQIDSNTIGPHNSLCIRVAGCYSSPDSLIRIMKNIIISNNGDGVLLEYVKGIEISSNNIGPGNEKGIELVECRTLGNTANKISSNSIYQNRGTGISLKKSVGNLIYQNTIGPENKNGIELNDCKATDDSSNVIFNNTLKSNKENGIFLEASYGNKIGKQWEANQNEITSNAEAGIGFKDCECPSKSPNIVTKNLVGPDNKEGIYIVNSSKNEINNNTIEGNNYGIRLSETVGNVIGYTKITENSKGIEISSGSGDLIVENEITDNRDVGVTIRHTDSTQIDGNTIRENGKNGLDLISAKVCEITNNTISKNKEEGLYIIGDSRNNRIAENEIIENVKNGIYLHGDLSSENSIFHNSVKQNKNDGISVGGKINEDEIRNNKIMQNEHIGINLHSLEGKINIINNEITENGWTGISCTSCKIEGETDEKSQITQNIIQNNELGISFDSSEKFEVRDNSIKNNRDDGFILDSSDEITIDNNKICENEDNGIEMNSGDNIHILNSLINENKQEGIKLYLGRSNSIENNDIQKNEKNGIVLNGTDNNSIFDNDISSNKANGVNMDDSKRNYFNNNEIIENKENGIYMVKNSNNNEMKYNDIIKNEKDGIYMSKGYFNKILNNVIKENEDDGIQLVESTQNTISNNRILQNCDGIDMWRGLLNYISNNTIENSWCIFTGIHLDETSPVVVGNAISGSAGDAILCENGSQPMIQENNILENAGSAINNTDPFLTVHAQNNWWGDVSGPGGKGAGSGDEVSGSVDFANWRTSPVTLVVVASTDTVFVPSGGKDSVYCSFQNWSNPEDVLSVNVAADSVGWLLGPTDFTAALEDSMGASAAIGLEVPAETPLGVANKVKVTAVSQTEPGATDADSFLVFTYHRFLAWIEVWPDTAFLNKGQKQQFTVEGYDSLGKAMDIDVVWSATGGTIDSTGLYTAGTKPGTFTVTAYETFEQIQAQAVVEIVPETFVSEEEQFIPSQFRLYQNYPNPFNPETNILFDVKERTRVVLKVYDMLGRELLNLMDKDYDPGRYDIIFDAGSFSSGLYFYRIQMGNFSDTKKMVFLK